MTNGRPNNPSQPRAIRSTAQLQSYKYQMKILYKYRSVGERTTDIICKKKVWLAMPETLNDPNECRFESPDPAQVRQAAEQIKQQQLEGFIMSALTAHRNGQDFFSLKGRLINRLLSRIKKASGQEARYKVAAGFLKEVGSIGFSDAYGQANSIGSNLKNLGIFSLSEDPLNMLMWSHYGDSHKGLAIGFAASNGSRLANPNHCRPVRYKSGASTFDFSGRRSVGLAYYKSLDGGIRPEAYVRIDDEQVQNVIFTKTEDWKYEKEWRYYEPHYGEYDHPGEVAEVVFGLNMPLEEREKFAAVCRGSIGNNVQFRSVVRPHGTQQLQLRDANV